MERTCLRNAGGAPHLQERYSRQEAGRKAVQVLLDTLKVCSRTRNLERGKKAHEEAVKSGHINDLYVATALINMYAKCHSMVDARKVFDCVRHPTVIFWNVLILGYAENGQGHTALVLLLRMRMEGHGLTSVTVMAALKACISTAVKSGPNQWAKSIEKGKQIHTTALENGCNSDVHVQNTLIDMYAKCGSMVDAREVFDGMQNFDVVSWNVLILGYADNGQGLTSLNLFSRMKIEGHVPDSLTVVAALKACTSLAVKEGANGWQECWKRGKIIHNIALENGCNVYVLNTLIDLYANCGSMVDAREVFDNMKHPDAVSWNAIILGYAENGQGHTSLELFMNMRSKGPSPNSVTFCAVLKACSLVTELEFGREIHLELNSKNGLDVVLVNCLVDFYAKCGSLVEAQKVFDAHAETRNIITWDALMAGYSTSGDNNVVFQLFDRMQDAGLKPDGITFLCILTCCSHAGLVAKGKEIFYAMSGKYGVIPSVKHYTCMIDLFGRANKLDDAMALLKHMPCSPNDVTWTTIVGASRKWENLEIGTLAFQLLVNQNGTN